MFDTVLISTDGSQFASRAAEHGLDIASRYDATVHALYVVDPDLVVLGSWGSAGREPLGPVTRVLSKTTRWPLYVYRE